MSMIKKGQESIIDRLQNQWSHMGFHPVNRLRTQSALNLQTELSLNNNHPPMTITATVMNVLTGNNTVCLILDAVVPEPLQIEDHLSGVCAFSQQVSQLFSPLCLIVDIESQRLIIRHGQLMSDQAAFSSRHFLVTSQKLAPLIQESIKTFTHRPCSLNESKNMAAYLFEAFHGEQNS